MSSYIIFFSELIMHITFKVHQRNWSCEINALIGHPLCSPAILTPKKKERKDLSVSLRSYTLRARKLPPVHSPHRRGFRSDRVVVLVLNCVKKLRRDWIFERQLTKFADRFLFCISLKLSSAMQNKLRQGNYDLIQLFDYRYHCFSEFVLPIVS